MKLKLALFCAALLFLTRAGATIILQESFTYGYGPLTNVSAGKWVMHSGSAATPGFNVASGLAQISASLADDVNAALTNSPYASSSSTGALYAAFDVNFSSLPTSGGAYFAHFKDNSTGFRARIFANLTGATAGSFRIGIANNSGTATNILTDLSLNTTYRIVIRHILATGVSTIWLSPSSELSTGSTGNDAPGIITVTSFALRQAAGEGILTVDNLVVGTTFADVVPGSLNPPFITVQPNDTNVAAGVTVTFKTIAGGNDPLSYYWFFASTLVGGNSNTLVLNSVTAGQSGNYSVIVSNSVNTVTSRVAVLTVVETPLAPGITNQPQSQTGIVGNTIVFNVGVTGTPPLFYRWFNPTGGVASTASALTLNSITTNDAGAYYVIITNSVGSATSLLATLTVIPPPATNIAYVRSLQEMVNYTPTNTTSLFTVEGIVTTYASLTGTGSLLFYMQDTTAGIAVFWSGAPDNALPHAGDRVRVTGPLTQFNGLLELTLTYTNTSHSVSVISSNNPIPAPINIPFASQNDPVVMEPLEGSYVVASNVFIDLTVPTFASGATYLVTNSSGQTFTLFINAQTDLVGQSKPTDAVTILGVLGQFDNSNPRTSGYQLIPSRYAEVISSSKAPLVRFTNFLSNLIRPGDLPTNIFVENALRTGEKLTMTVRVTDPDGGTITPLSNGLPATASWSYGATTGTNVTATFTFQPSGAEAGNVYTPGLTVANATTTKDIYWTNNVPTVAEQGVVISEILANPATATNSVYFNPLKRSADWATNSASSFSINDEYIEVVNLSPSALDFVGWTVYDAVQLRHEFGDFFSVPSSNAFILYGGPLNGFNPGISGMSQSASSTTLSLNNTGSETVALRNASGRLVTRVVYQGADVGTSSSISRFPSLNSPFVPQQWISTNLASPNAQYDNRAFTLAPASVAGPDVTSSVVTNTALITFPATPGHVSTLWQATEITNRFRVVNGSLFTNASGIFNVGAPSASRQFYFISTQ